MSSSISDNGPNITVTNIQNLVRIIDYAAEQGAFRGWAVIEQVLKERNTANDFVQAVARTTAASTLPNDVDPTEVSDKS